MKITKYEPKRIFREGRRGYQVEKNFYPGVTTILYNTLDEKERKKLDNWRKRIGEENAREINKEAMMRGNVFHEFMEKDLNNTNTEIRENIRDFWKKGEYINKLIKSQHKVLVTEGMVWSEKHKFAGTPDCVTLCNNELILWDWKTSAKLKKRKWITDYFLQVAAYCQAFKETYPGCAIAEAKIVVFVANKQPQIFDLEEEELDKYFQEFLVRLKGFLVAS